MMFHLRVSPERWECKTSTILWISCVISVFFTIFGIAIIIHTGHSQTGVFFIATSVLIILYMTRVVASKFFHLLNNGVPQGQQNLGHMQLLAAMGIRDHPLVQQVIRELGYVPGPPATHGLDQNAVEMVPMAAQR